MPRFREPSVLWLAPPRPRQAIISIGKHASVDGSDEADALKLSLAFSESRFVVPWVATRSSGSGETHALRLLKVTFLYSGSDLLQVKWGGDYKAYATDVVKVLETNSSGSRPPNSVAVQYEWVEVAEHDLESGLVLMFAVCLAAALASLIATCSRGDAPGPSKEREWRRPVAAPRAYKADKGR